MHITGFHTFEESNVATVVLVPVGLLFCAMYGGMVRSFIQLESYHSPKRFGLCIAMRAQEKKEQAGKRQIPFQSYIHLVFA